MMELAEAIEAEKRLVLMIADTIQELSMPAGDYTPRVLSDMVVDLATLRSLIRAKKI
jgi:hypothetical protein